MSGDDDAPASAERARPAAGGGRATVDGRAPTHASDGVDSSAAASTVDPRAPTVASAPLDSDAAGPSSPVDARALTVASDEVEATAPTEGPALPAGRAPTEASASFEGAADTVWAPGAVVLDRYQVVEVLGRGGMGEVLRVRHLEWAIDLAVKAPLAAHLLTPGARADFEREAETWVELGVHPNIVTCYFVRRVAGVPRVFAEYVPGGTLADHIAEGLELPRILDLAIQVAHGLRHAHAHDLVHQDVKPGNVMVTRTGVAKMTDFGLAQARATLTRGGRGLTPRYAAPEQLARGALGPSCDVFAWAVMLVEMLVPGARWGLGPQIVTAWARRPALPTALVELVDACLAPAPADRPPGFSGPIERLRAVYGEVSGHAYPRPAPQPGHAMADAEVNRAVSLFELGHGERARGLLERALARDPDHTVALYNHGLLRWRAGELDAAAAARPLVEPAPALAAWIHVEAGDVDRVRRLVVGRDDPEAGRAGRAAQPGRALELDHALHDGVAVALSLAPDGRGLAAVGLDLQPLPPPTSARAAGRDAARGGDIAEAPGATAPRWSGHLGPVTALAFLDVRRWVSAGGDGRVIVWVEGAPTRTLKADAPLRAVAAAGQALLAGARDGALWLWRGDVHLPLPRAHTSAVVGVALAGGYAFSAGTDGRLVRTRLLDGEVRARSLESAAVALDWDAGRLLVATERGVTLHDPESLRVLRRWPTSGATAAALTGPHAVVAHDDGSVSVYAVGNGRLLQRWPAHGGGVLALAAASRRVLSGGADGGVRRWRLLDTPRAPHRVVRPRATEDLLAHREAFEAALAEAEEAPPAAANAALDRARALPGFARDPRALAAARRLVARCGRGPLRDAWVAEARPVGDRPAAAVASSPAGVLAVGDWSGGLRIGDAHIEGAHRDLVGALCWDGERLLSGGADGRVRAWSTRGEPLSSLARGGSSVEALAPGAVGRADGVVEVEAGGWAHAAPVRALARLGERVYSGAEDGLRRGPDGERVDDAPVSTLLALGDSLLVGRPDGRLTDRAAGSRRFDAGIRALSASADGEVLAVLLADGDVHLCDRALHTLRRLAGVDPLVSAIALTPSGDGLHLVGRRASYVTLDWWPRID